MMEFNLEFNRSKREHQFKGQIKEKRKGLFIPGVICPVFKAGCKNQLD